ncbi:MAG: hypothetical protein JW990_18850, partial [Thermoleophilia bacterium]|nr:hypothetical protein [Thermoleophilia bacterium]
MDLKSVVPTYVPGKRRRRLLVTLCTGAIVVAALVASLVTLAFAVPPSFPDVPASHPYHAAISGLAS